MRHHKLLLAIGLFTTTPSFLPAQSRAAIEGDVYLLNKAGDVKKGAAGTVGILPAGARTDSIVANACREMDRVVEAGTKEIKASRASLETQMDVMLKLGNRGLEVRSAAILAKAQTSATGMNAHYSFTGIRSGKYFIVSYMKMGDDVELWAVPVTLSAGQHMKLDLDNNNTGSQYLPCR